MRTGEYQLLTRINRRSQEIHEIQPGEEVEAIVLQMVGDLAAYRPGAKVVFFEGENSEFDLSMVSRLFPAIEKELNLVSGGNRYRVETLHRTLERSIKEGNIPIKIYSVVDRDSGTSAKDGQEYGRHFSWDVYHIENYLLEAEFILEALSSINVSNEEISSIVKVNQCLAQIAEEQVGKLVSHKVRAEIGSELVKELDLNVNSLSANIGEELYSAMLKSSDRIKELIGGRLSNEYIGRRVEEETQALEAALVDGSWKEHFRGRDMLRVFVGKYVPGMGYEYFRDLVISQMAKSGYMPEGMRSVLDKIVND